MSFRNNDIIAVLTTPPANAEVTLATAFVQLVDPEFVVCNAVNIGTESVDGVLKLISDSKVIVENHEVPRNRDHPIAGP